MKASAGRAPFPNIVFRDISLTPLIVVHYGESIARRREEEESENPGAAAETEERNKNIGENRENILNENTSQRFIIQITLHQPSHQRGRNVFIFLSVDFQYFNVTLRSRMFVDLKFYPFHREIIFILTIDFDRFEFYDRFRNKEISHLKLNS